MWCSASLAVASSGYARKRSVMFIAISPPSAVPHGLLFEAIRSGRDVVGPPTTLITSFGHPVRCLNRVGWYAYLVAVYRTDVNGHEYYNHIPRIVNMAICNQCGVQGDTLYYCDTLDSAKMFLCENCHPTARTDEYP